MKRNVLLEKKKKKKEPKQTSRDVWTVSSISNNPNLLKRPKKRLNIVFSFDEHALFCNRHGTLREEKEQNIHCSIDLQFKSLLEIVRSKHNTSKMIMILIATSKTSYVYLSSITSMYNTKSM